MFARIFVLLCLIAVASAWAPARQARASMALFSDKQSSMKIMKSAVSNETCEERKIDKNGRCPGEAGYYPPNNKAPKDFAEFQKEMAAKKAAAKK